MRRGFTRSRQAIHRLTPEEREAIAQLRQSSLLGTARMLGVGVQTLWALVSPEGEVSQPVLARVRARLSELTSARVSDPES